MEAISTNMFLQEELNLQNDPELKTEVKNDSQIAATF